MGTEFWPIRDLFVNMLIWAIRDLLSTYFVFHGN